MALGRIPAVQPGKISLRYLLSAFLSIKKACPYLEIRAGRLAEILSFSEKSPV
jgi:hypothetical protein